MFVDPFKGRIEGWRSVNDFILEGGLWIERCAGE